MGPEGTEGAPLHERTDNVHRELSPQEINLLKRAFDCLGEGVLVVDAASHRILLSNGALERLLACSAEHLFGINSDILYEDPKAFADSLAHLTGDRGADLAIHSELEMKRSDGTIILTEHSISRISDATGDSTGFVSVIREAAARRKAADTLERERALLRTIIESIPDEICLKDVRHRYLLANRASVSSLGAKSLDDMLGKTDLDYVRPDLAASHLAEERAVLESGIAIVNRERVRRNRVTHELEKCDLSTKLPIRDAGGRITGLLVINRDTTERMRAEEALRKSEERYRGLAENFPNGTVSIYDQDLRMVFAAGAELRGNQARQFIGKRFHELVPPGSAAIAEPHLRAAFEGKTGSYEIPYWDGRTYAVGVSPLADKDGTIKEIMVVSQEVTGFKRAEEALRSSEERFRRYFELGLVGLAITSPEKGWIDVNDEICALLGYERSELIKMTWAELTHPDDLAADVTLFNQVVTGEIDGYTIDKRFIRKDGRVIFATISVKCLRRPDGSIDYFVALVQDITQRKIAEEALRASELRYRQLHETLMDAFVSVSMNGRIMEFNEVYRKMLGYEHDELLTLTYRQLTPEIWHAREADIVANQVLRHGYSDIYEKEYRRKDGTVFPIELRTFLIRDPAGNPWRMWAMVRDITHRKQIEEELNRSREALRALTGRLQTAREQERAAVAREIHDELGQVLTALKMDLALLLKSCEAEPPREFARDAAGEIREMSKLVGSAIRTVRKLASELRPEMLDLLGLVAALRWQAEQFEQRFRIRCILSLPAEPFELDADRSVALFRIFQEALTNVARHAEATLVEAALSELDGVIELRIQDNGKGIPGEVTTNQYALGLLGMRERAFSFGGSVEFKGVAGKGTAVIARLPMDRSHPA